MTEGETLGKTTAGGWPMTREQPEQRRPPEAWVLLRYTKLGPSRFMSARDVARVMERAVKRAGVPVAYSSGFSPHQRISYAFPAPTGAASEAEYALVALESPMAPDEVTAKLNAVMPSGMQVTASTTDKAPLPPRLEVSTWRVAWPDAPSSPDLSSAVDAFMTAKEVVVDRRAKSGIKPQDVRAAVVSMTAADALEMTLFQGEPLIRPGDVLAGLAQLWADPATSLHSAQDDGNGGTQDDGNGGTQDDGNGGAQDDGNGGTQDDGNGGAQNDGNRAAQDDGEQSLRKMTGAEGEARPSLFRSFQGRLVDLA